MKELEFSIGRNIGGGLLLVGLAPEPRFTGEGNPRIAPRQVPPVFSATLDIRICRRLGGSAGQLVALIIGSRCPQNEVEHHH